METCGAAPWAVYYARTVGDVRAEALANESVTDHDRETLEALRCALVRNKPSPAALRWDELYPGTTALLIHGLEYFDDPSIVSALSHSVPPELLKRMVVDNKNVRCATQFAREIGPLCLALVPLGEVNRVLGCVRNDASCVCAALRNPVCGSPFLTLLRTSASDPRCCAACRPSSACCWPPRRWPAPRSGPR